MAKKKSKHKFGEDVENYIAGLVYDEYKAIKSARTADIAEFESIVQMLECQRGEKDYDWLSNYFYPELPAKLHTEAANWAGKDFGSRDFVEVKLDGDSPVDPGKCEAAKRTLNKTLNNRNIYHYHKRIRGKLINAIGGQVYTVGWWEQETRPVVVGIEKVPRKTGVDVFGMPMSPQSLYPERIEYDEKPIYDEEIIIDQFNYDVFPPHNVFTDNSYCYSPQDKPFITFRMESTYESLRETEDKNEYFNLDIVKELVRNQQASKTETAEDTQKNMPETNLSKPVVQYFDRLLRFGKMWVVVDERDDRDYPVTIKPGYDKQGELLKDAELIETITEEVIVNGTKVLIRFQPNPFRTRKGKSYRPIARGWCYIHPTQDKGLGDGKYLRENQIGINDHLNMGTDRVKLATIPTMKGNAAAIADNPTLYFEPQHIMELQNVETDLQEFKIDDNIDGALAVMNVLMEGNNRVTSIFPTTEGNLPRNPSQSATAVAGSQQNSNARANYKELTWTHTYEQDFFWMILQMTDQFARPKTALKMMGQYAKFFDPEPTYTYTPVASNVETEFNKYRKIQMYDQTIGRLAPIAPMLPTVVPLIAHMIARQQELMGDEYQTISGMIRDLAQSQPVPEGPQGEQTQQGGPTPASNQRGLPMSTMEQGTRNQMNMGMMR